MRLIGGSSETEGTVEVCHNKTWGMVSGLGWGEEDARVICIGIMYVLFLIFIYSDILFNFSQSQAVQSIWQHHHSRGYAADLHIKPVEGSV